MARTSAKSKKKPAKKKPAKKKPATRKGANKKKTDLREHAGQPPIIQSPEELYARACEYFDLHPGEVPLRDNKGRIVFNLKLGKPATIIKAPTLAGLALHLGFVSRQSLYDYEAKPEYSYVVKWARLRVIAFAEGMLYTPYAYGAKFALSNMGNADDPAWSDRKDITGRVDHAHTHALHPELRALVDRITGMVSDKN